MGNLITVVGIVSTVVVTGFSAQLLRLWSMMQKAVVKAVVTATTQNTRLKELVPAIRDRPAVEELSRKSVTRFILHCTGHCTGHSAAY